MSEQEQEADGDDGKDCFGVDQENERDSGMDNGYRLQARAAAELDDFPLLPRSFVLCVKFSQTRWSKNTHHTRELAKGLKVVPAGPKTFKKPVGLEMSQTPLNFPGALQKGMC
eukprot:1030866-Pelagomonas_calceolata.AAC.4